MFIANARYKCSAHGTNCLKICTDYKTEKDYQKQNTDNLIHLSYDKELPDLIMKLAATSELPVQFNFRNNEWTLISYSFNGLERYYNKYRNNYLSGHIKLAKKSEIVVYTGRCSCPRCYAKYGFDGIENYCGRIALKGNNHKIVEIDIQRCTRCLTYFIDKQSLELYENKFGNLDLICYSMQEFMRMNSDWNDGYFNDDSILSRNGYFAGLPLEERRRALIHMMENGIPKSEIKNKLTEFIEYRGERCYKAEPIWRADLLFVNDYCLREETNVNFVE